jgi:hypothetical protein
MFTSRMRTARHLLVLFVCAAILPAALAQSARTALHKLQIEPEAVGWNDCPFVNTSGLDCFIPDEYGGSWSTDALTASLVGYYGDPNTGIPVGSTYYVRLFAQRQAVCQTVYVQPYLPMPAGTSLNVSAQNPIICYYNGNQTTSGCTQNPSLQVIPNNGSQGYNFGIWNINPQGSNVEIWVPVVSSTTGTKTLFAHMEFADGTNLPSEPSKQYIVVASTPPSLIYPQPSATQITDTDAKTTVDVYNHYTAGTTYFDIGTDTNYTLAGSAPISVSNLGDAFEVYTTWNGTLSPGTTYHWRARFVYGSNQTISGTDQIFTTTGSVGVPGVPTGVGAVAAPGEIYVTWTGVTGATSYDVYRRAAGSPTYFFVGNSTLTTYHDTTAQANNAYLYRVRAKNSAGSALDSASDLATMILFTDDPALTGTPIRIAHLAELRTAVNAVRALAGIGPGTYTGVAASGLTVKAVHILELRSQFEAALGPLNLPASSWADTPAAGTIIGRWHVQQLRDRLK